MHTAHIIEYKYARTVQVAQRHNILLAHKEFIMQRWKLSEAY
jgi:hypothetical protein